MPTAAPSFNPARAMGLVPRDYASYFDEDDGTNPNSPNVVYPRGFRTEGYSSRPVVRPSYPNAYERQIQDAGIMARLNQAQAQTELQSGGIDLETPEGVQKMARHIQTGALSPTQARTMLYAQRMLHPVAPVEKPVKPRAIDQKTRGLIDESLNAYKAYTAPGGSEEAVAEKADAYQMKHGKPPTTPAEWQEAYHLHGQNLLKAVRQHVENAKRWGYAVPDGLVPQEENVLRGTLDVPQQEQNVMGTAANPVPIASITPEQYGSAPAGTYFQLPNGQLKIKR